MLRPFSRFCVRIGAVPPSIIKSLSYEEQLIKLVKFLKEQVVPAIDDNADAIEELQTAMVQLENYVNNYFDNLDVQEEINQKLDEMAEDGTLTQLIGNYVNPLIEEQNEHINEVVTEQNKLINQTITTVNSSLNTMNEKINALESGSPLVASSTADMTDTTRIYVNTTDGYWYYYDGDSWEQGGQYQSDGISNNSIGYDKLTIDLENQLSTRIDMNSTIWKDGFYGLDGTYSTNSAYKTTKPIRVTPNMLIRTNCNTTAGALTTVEVDSSGNYVDTVKVGDNASSTVDSPLVEFYSPSSETYYCFTYRVANFTSVFINITNTEKLNYQEINPLSKKGLEPQFDKYSNVWSTGVFMIESGSQSKNTGYNITEPIKVFKGQIITTNCNVPIISSLICKTDKNGNYISNLKAGSGNDPVESSYNVTEDCYVRIAYRNVNNNNPWIKITNYKEQITKKGIAYGDSLWSNSQGNFNYPSTPYHQSTGECYGYDDWLKQSNIDITNYGASGTAITTLWNDTTYEHCIQNLTESDLTDIDFVILSYGRNDSRGAIPLGTLGDQNTSYASLDTNTIYGAYRKCIEYLLSLKPSLKIFLWTMTQTDANNWGPTDTNIQGLKQIDYVNAVKDVAKLYAMPVVDMYNESGINIYNLEEFTFEGVHLTNDGYEYTAQYYVNKMKDNLFKN